MIKKFEFEFSSSYGLDLTGVIENDWYLVGLLNGLDPTVKMGYGIKDQVRSSASDQTQPLLILGLIKY